MLTDAELAEIEALAKAQPDLVVRGAGEEEYYAYFVELGLADTFDPTPPLLVSAYPSPDTTEQAEQEKARNMAAFHIAAKSTILTLLAELRRLRGMKCETCAHWEDRSCDKGTVCGDVDCEGCEDEHRHDCKLMFRPGTPKHPESLAVAHDCEDYGAWVQTKPDFSCNQWTPPKEATP